MKKIMYFLPLVFGLCFISCENEPINPAQINTAIVDEELFTFLELITDEPTDLSINCIEFNYSFTIFSFDENLDLADTRAVFNNKEFIALLEALPENYSISVNYPISGTLNNGELIEIPTNEELKNAIKKCSKEERKRRCNNTLIACTWAVTPVTGSTTNFEGAAFKINRNGTVQFHYNTEVFFGTWITLYIGEELFLNIDLNDHPEVEGFWDFNWKVDLFSDEQIFISNDTHSVLLEKECSLPCTADGYQVCELKDTPGVANFNLQKYTPCIAVPSTHDVLSSITHSFFSTEEDALTNANALTPTNYTNVENPQTIFIRIAYNTSGELLEITQITIEAVPCTGG
ncbi:hypothetical protein [Rasiella sp. SM2506]|uniref:hypothetical protein n=1 Tax=Rasiella sp. SM2506 TaxID=3423914 RepID=UPI003D7A1252